MNIFNKQIHSNEFRLRILLTNQCNRNCSFCLNDFQPKIPARYIDPYVAIKYIKFYGSFMKSINKKSIITFSGGEPGLHPNFNSILFTARKHCDIVKVATNCTAMTKLRCDFVDCWHVGTSLEDPFVRDFASTYDTNVIPQLVVTDTSVIDKIVSWVAFYTKYGLTTKLFTDFYSNNQQELRNKIAYVVKLFDNKVITRFTGIQENRGIACNNCNRKCITLKALWVFPNGYSSICPQDRLPYYSANDDLSVVFRKSYELTKKIKEENYR